MPIYVVKCVVCDEKQEVFRSVRNYNDTPEHCGEKTERVMCAPFVMSDIQPYKCIVTGQEVSSRTQRREIIKRNDLIEIGDAKLTGQRPKLDTNVAPELHSAVREVLSKR